MSAFLPTISKTIRNRCIRNFNSTYPEPTVQTLTFDNGKYITVSTDEIPEFADGACKTTIGGTTVMATSVSKARTGPQAGFVPLTVDYKQSYSSARRTPTNMMRREMGVSDGEILTSRSIDRSVRPLFPKGFSYDTQIICQLAQASMEEDPDVVGINAASMSLAISDIPWNGPVGAVRVGVIDGEVVTLPTRKERQHSQLNLIIASVAQKKVVMLQGEGKPIEHDLLKKAIRTGLKDCEKVVQFIADLAKNHGKPKRQFTPVEMCQELLEAVRMIGEFRVRDIFTDFTHDKLSRDRAVQALRKDIFDKLTPSFPAQLPMIGEAFDVISKQVFRDLILHEDIRCDGRGLDQLRDIRCRTDIYPVLHGSSFFKRGQTQVESCVALDDVDEFTRTDSLLEATGSSMLKNFKLNYRFPSNANGEIGKLGAISRREIGHGTLAQKALMPLIPADYPFYVHIDALVTQSNGSSSMATVCGGTLALLDAGVPITKPAAGVAIGLVAFENEHGKIEQHKVLTDILGIEDYLGDMDFKIAGTSQGVTALQADIKLNGVDCSIIMEAIGKALKAKTTILGIMKQTIATPHVKQDRPVIDTVTVPAQKRHLIVGPAGINLKKIRLETNAKFTWRDNNALSIFTDNQHLMDEVLKRIDELTKDNIVLEDGAILVATITEIRNQGVMISLYDNMTPVLLHNSQLDTRKVLHPSALNMEVGQQIKVKYFGRDPTSGHMRLSRKALQGRVKPTVDLHKQLNDIKSNKGTL